MIPPEHAAAQVDGSAPGDRGDRVAGLGDRLGVRVEIEVALLACSGLRHEIANTCCPWAT